MRLRTTVTLALLSSIGLMGCGPDDGSASSSAVPGAHAQLSPANANAAVSPSASPSTSINTNAPANAGPNATSLAAAQPDPFPNEPPPVPPVVHYPPESSSN